MTPGRAASRRPPLDDARAGAECRREPPAADTRGWSPDVSDDAPTPGGARDDPGRGGCLPRRSPCPGPRPAVPGRPCSGDRGAVGHVRSRGRGRGRAHRRARRGRTLRSAAQGGAASHVDAGRPVGARPTADITVPGERSPCTRCRAARRLRRRPVRARCEPRRNVGLPRAVDRAPHERTRATRAEPCTVRALEQHNLRPEPHTGRAGQGPRVSPRRPAAPRPARHRRAPGSRPPHHCR